MFKFISRNRASTIFFVGAGKGSNSDLDCLIFFDILRKEWLEAAVPKRKIQNALKMLSCNNCNFAYPSINSIERTRIIGNFCKMKENNMYYLLFERLIEEKNLLSNVKCRISNSVFFLQFFCFRFKFLRYEVLKYLQDFYRSKRRMRRNCAQK